MTTTAAPFGFRPISHPSGTIRLEALTDGIASAYATAIYENTPIKWVTGGTITVAAAGENVLGVFTGVEFSSGGRRYIQNYWPASQAFDTGSCIARYTKDKEIEYEAQGTGSFPQTAVGDCADLSGTSGSTITGISSGALSTVQGASAQFQIQNLSQYPDNAWGDTYTIVQCRIYEYQLVV